jgi:hypothetical protein
VAAAGGAASQLSHATLTAARMPHSAASTSVADRGQAACGPRRAKYCRSLAPAATPSTYPATAMTACRAGLSDEVPTARPTNIRLPVMTLVKAPPMIIRVTTSIPPLVNVSRPTRCAWRWRSEGSGDGTLVPFAAGDN